VEQPDFNEREESPRKIAGKPSCRRENKSLDSGVNSDEIRKKHLTTPQKGESKKREELNAFRVGDLLSGRQESDQTGTAKRAVWMEVLEGSMGLFAVSPLRRPEMEIKEGKGGRLLSPNEAGGGSSW